MRIKPIQWGAAPVVEEHAGVLVVRDDLHPGGTKGRVLISAMRGMFNLGIREVVYASPSCGGAQLALAYCARELGMRTTVFVAARARRHPRTEEAAAAGARVVEVRPGYLTVVQARARAYCEVSGAHLIPWGAEGVITPEALAHQARRAKLPTQPAEVWCAAGSGVLSRGLQAAWPRARHWLVQVGAEVDPARVRQPGVVLGLKRSPVAFERESATKPPFPSCPNYDAKAWDACAAEAACGTVVFWNVMGASPTVHAGSGE